ncbi:hypothetical protein ANN_25129 [Periplaneta americana]|uniref:C2H2-type domain-containing protein n=1 Tax=Periplaneta americana TaxID=6978 RepID=A0ABQ8S0F4_PERAM|nr:hypothetical protein ANN_25129 [Periplaneta americana]
MKSWNTYNPLEEQCLGSISTFEPFEQLFQLNQEQQTPVSQELRFSYPMIGKTNFKPNDRPNSGYECETCGKVYRWKESLYNHKKLECGKEPQFQCPFCPHRAKLNWNLQKHIRLKHP